jgi:hypothetical protein
MAEKCFVYFGSAEPTPPCVFGWHHQRQTLIYQAGSFTEIPVPLTFFMQINLSVNRLVAQF